MLSFALALPGQLQPKRMEFVFLLVEIAAWNFSLPQPFPLGEPNWAYFLNRYREQADAVSLIKRISIRLIGLSESSDQD
jgi:hypothetical protein